MNFWPDIVVQDPNGRPIAWVEVKRNRATLDFDAREYFVRAKEALQESRVRFYLLVTPEEVYLWDLDRPISAESREPLAMLSHELPEFLSSRVTTPGEIRTLEFAVYNWLVDIILRDEKRTDPVEQMLRDSGFIAALKNSELRFGERR